MENLPPVCSEIVSELKKRGLIITTAYYNDTIDACVIDFRDRLTEQKLSKAQGVVPRAWFTSSIVYFIPKKIAEINFNRAPPDTFFELFIPEECGNGTCRVHVFFDPELPRFGFQAGLLSKESLKKFLDYFFS